MGDGRNTVRAQYCNQKSAAKRRGIPFLLTFGQWLAMWKKSGCFGKRGKRLGQYVMARKGDKGGYSVGNVRIITTSANVKERRYRHSELSKSRIAAAKSDVTGYWCTRNGSQVWIRGYRRNGSRV